MGPPPMVCCVTECVMKELKIFVDGKIDSNAAVTQLIGSDTSLKSVSILKYLKLQIFNLSFSNKIDSRNCN